MYFNRHLTIMILFALVAIVSCTKSNQLIKNQTNFSIEQSAIIVNRPADQPMRVFKINNYQDSLLLRKKSQQVDLSYTDPELKLFIDRLYSTVRDSMSLGVGIAAPQVGILKNIVWVQRFDKDEFPFEVYINPVITDYSDEKQDCREGCLSIPDRSDTTKIRAKTIEIEYDKIDNTHHRDTVSDFTAVIFQHEIDHLHGILYIDHLNEEVQSNE